MLAEMHMMANMASATCAQDEGDAMMVTVAITATMAMTLAILVCEHTGCVHTILSKVCMLVAMTHIQPTCICKSFDKSIL